MKNKTSIAVSLTNAELLGSQQALQRLAALPLPANSAYWIGKTLKKVTGKMLSLDKALQKQRYDLIVSLGTQAMIDGPVVGEQIPSGNWTVLPENEAHFQELWQTILDKPVEMEILPIDLTLLGDSRITAGDAATLGWLLACDEDA